MKNLILTCICMFSIQAYSQTFKGDIGIGGQAWGSYNQSDYGKYFGLGIAPESGYFLFDNLLVGARLGYSYSVNEFEIYPATRETMHRHRLQLGPFVRYYVPVNPKWRGILHAGYDWYWNFNPDDNETHKYSDYQLGLGSGYFIAENIALEGMFYYLKDQNAIFRAGLQVYIGRNRSGDK